MLKYLKRSDINRSNYAKSDCVIISTFWRHILKQIFISFSYSTVILAFIYKLCTLFIYINKYSRFSLLASRKLHLVCRDGIREKHYAAVKMDHSVQEITTSRKIWKHHGMCEGRWSKTACNYKHTREE